MASTPAPPNWHLAVNLPLAVLWMIGIPFAGCWYLPIPFWWAVPITPAWILITARVADCGIPALTAPVVDKVYGVLGKARETPE
jgi:hypothetical protein